jgi:hypothetical protein
MDISTIPHVCDFIIPPRNGHIHMCVSVSFHLHMELSTSVWLYHSTYKWTYPQYHMCDFIIPPTNELVHNTINSHICGIVDLSICSRMIKSHTCGIVDKSICRWNDKITHMWMCQFVGMCVSVSFHLQMDISTCVWFYHSTYKWTCPQSHMCVILSFHLQMELSTIPHVCGFIIRLTNGLIHNTTDKITHMWISPCVGGMIKSHTCG